MHYTEKNNQKPEEHLPSYPQTHQLKVQPLFRPTRYGQTMVPELRINGRWLENAGFIAEQRVNITVTEKLLIIRLCEPDE